MRRSERAAPPRATPRALPPWARFAALRCFAAVALRRGYVHPDEWWQSVEPAAAALLRLRTPLPWEFTAAAPARSALAPLLAAGPPLAVLRLLGRITPAGLIALPRLYLALLGGACQAAAARGAAAAGAAPSAASRAGVAAALSWPALVLLPRPFSNSLEALALAATALLALPGGGSAPSRLALLALGAIAAAATFVRFTFPLFAAPLLLLALWRCAAAAAARAPTPHATAAALRAACASLVCLAAGFVAAAAAAIAADTAFYGRAVLTPLNSLRYNADAANLAQHGLHPRGLHACVNLPLLFAPLLPGAAASAVAAAQRLRRKRRGGAGALAPGADVAAAALAACVALPLVALSAAPHQEPRFLLPLLVPLSALGGASALATRRRAILFAAFNAALALLFGAAHQAGILPATSAISHLAHQSMTSPSSSSGNALAAALAASAHAPPPGCGGAGAHAVHALYWRTYPPPHSLLLLPRQHADGAVGGAQPSVVVTDLQGASVAELAAALAAYSDTSSSESVCGRCSVRLLVAPAAVPLPAGLTSESAAELALFWPHFSGEDLAASAAALAGGAPLRRAFGLALYALPPAPCA